MDWIVVAGVVSLGAIVGWMGCMLYFGSRDVRTFGAIITVFCGTVILGFFQSFAGQGLALPHEVWLYPVGLLLGVAISSSIYGYQYRQKEAEKRRQMKTNETERKIEADKATIILHIKNKKGPSGKPITMISFERLRDDLHRPDMTEQYIYQIIDRYPAELCRKKLKTGRGVGLAHS